MLDRAGHPTAAGCAYELKWDGFRRRSFRLAKYGEGEHKFAQWHSKRGAVDLCRRDDSGDRSLGRALYRV